MMDIPIFIPQKLHLRSRPNLNPDIGMDFLLTLVMTLEECTERYLS